jgi:hypothetical protein
MGVRRGKAKERPARGSERRRASRGDRNEAPSRSAGWKTIPLRDAGICTSILCATLLAYLPALRGGLVWDDSGHVTRLDLQSLHGLWRIWFELGATQQYYQARSNSAPAGCQELRPAQFVL